MSEPIWIEVTSSHEAVELVETLARHGIRGASIATGDGAYVRIPASREQTPELLRDVSVALSRSDAGRRAHRRYAAQTKVDDQPLLDDAEGPKEHLHLSSALGRELKRIAQNPIREVERLEREAQAGQNPATPVILIAGLAVSLWTFVALVVATALLVAHLIV